MRQLPERLFLVLLFLLSLPVVNPCRGRDFGAGAQWQEQKKSAISASFLIAEIEEEVGEGEEDSQEHIITAISGSGLFGVQVLLCFRRIALPNNLSQDWLFFSGGGRWLLRLFCVWRI